jgi:endonuclease III
VENVIKILLKNFPKTYSEELGIDLKSKKPKEIFKWFLASILFGHRISETIAKNTYREFEKEKLLSPKAILDAGWDELVRVLDNGGYVRYDFSTASALLDIMRVLKEKYGSLEKLYEKSKDSKDLEVRLQEFKRVGPTTVNIFLRELRVIWPKTDPKISGFVRLAAGNLGIDLTKFDKKSKKFIRLESALLRLGKDFCRKRKCASCLVRRFCRKAGKNLKN